MKDYAVGQHIELKRVVTQSDFDRFAALSGDDNPIHVDPVFSARTKFGRTVAHGMFLYSSVCGVLSSFLPGPNVQQLEQQLKFPNPTFAGDEISIRLEIVEIMATSGIVRLNTIVTRSAGETVLEGAMLVQTAKQNNPAAMPVFMPSSATDEEKGPFRGLKVGQNAEIRRTFTTENLAEYADLVHDPNPLLADATLARAHGFQNAPVPGGLIGGMFSYLLGTKLPGRGTNYLKQRMQFWDSAHPDEALTASVKITRIRNNKQLVNLTTLCINPAGTVLCKGEALVLVSDLEST